jgi:hypothetical protein
MGDLAALCPPSTVNTAIRGTGQAVVPEIIEWENGGRDKALQLLTRMVRRDAARNRAPVKVEGSRGRLALQFERQLHPQTDVSDCRRARRTAQWGGFQQAEG